MEERSTIGDLLELFTFILDSDEYALDIKNITEVDRIREITPITNSLPYVKGKMNAGGEIIPIIDTRVQVGLPRREYDDETRIIVIDIDGTKNGFIVDAVREVLRVPSTIVESAHKKGLKINMDFVDCVVNLGERYIVLLDCSRLICKNKRVHWLMEKKQKQEKEYKTLGHS